MTHISAGNATHFRTNVRQSRIFVYGHEKHFSLKLQFYRPWRAPVAAARAKRYDAGLDIGWSNMNNLMLK
jgi:hypothetical protein